MRIHDYEKLLVWQKSMDLVIEIYRLTKQFPSSEIYVLVSQMRRASISIPSNIAEGSRRNTKKDFCRFLILAFSSGSELETQIKIAERLNFGKVSGYSKINMLLTEIMKMLNKLIEVNQ